MPPAPASPDTRSRRLAAAVRLARREAANLGAGLDVAEDKGAGPDSRRGADSGVVAHDRRHPDERVLLDDAVAGDVDAGVERREGADRRVVANQHPAAEDGVLLIDGPGGVRLALGETEEPIELPGFFHFGFTSAAGPEEVRAFRDRLAGDGIEIAEFADEPAYVSVKCRDPDGYVIEFAWEPDGWAG